jgi:hypothetical protein
LWKSDGLLFSNAPWRSLDEVALLLIHDIGYHLIHRSEGYVCGASFFTQTTVDAVVNHVDGPREQKVGILGRKLGSGHEGFLLKGAFLAKANRTDISTPVAFDASVGDFLDKLKISNKVF